MDFVIGLPISTDWKGNSYNSTFVIIHLLIKIVYYKPVKVIDKKLQPFQLHCHQQTVTIYFIIWVIAMLYFRYQAKTLHRFLPLDK